MARVFLAVFLIVFGLNMLLGLFLPLWLPGSLAVISGVLLLLEHFRARADKK